MKIEAVETYRAHDWLFVRVVTDTGLTGVGESTLFTWPASVEAIVDAFRGRLIGADPMRVEDLWLELYRGRSIRGMEVTAALSAIDQALWDIRGKQLQAPVWQLLGGKVREKVRALKVLVYGTPDEVVEQAVTAGNEGYTAVKVLLFQPEHHQLSYGARLKDMVERAHAIRDAVGWDLDLGFELHRNMAPGEAVALLRELEDVRPYFAEDPVPPDSVLSMGEVSAKSRVPMAAGERNTTIWEFREYIEAAGVAHIKPDIGIAGGFTHLRKICAIAEAHHVGILPHAVPSGPVATMAHVHLGAATPNYEAQEYRPQNKEPWTAVVDHIAEVVDGYFVIPEVPGLGIDLDLDGIARTPEFPRAPKTPRRADGSIGFR